MIRKELRLLVPTLLAVFAFPAVALAADAEGGADAGALTKIVGSTLTWSIIVFTAVLFILKQKAWGPILQALDEREEKIKSSLEAAERALEESAQRQKEHEAVMAEARREATAIVEEGKRDAQVVKDGIVADARREAEELTRRATAEIDRAKNIAADELRKTSIDLSMQIAQAVIAKSLSPQDHEQLIQETIDRYQKS